MQLSQNILKKIQATTTSIAGLITLPLQEIATEGGSVLHMLRSDNPLFTSFGEVYFSENLPNITKPWKRHLKQTQHFAVPIGRLQIYVYDARENSSSKNTSLALTLGRPENYVLLRIPPLVWYTFSALGKNPALIANLTDIPHNPKETETLAFTSFPLPN